MVILRTITYKLNDSKLIEIYINNVYCSTFSNEEIVYLWEDDDEVLDDEWEKWLKYCYNSPVNKDYLLKFKYVEPYSWVRINPITGDIIP